MLNKVLHHTFGLLMFISLTTSCSNDNYVGAGENAACEDSIRKMTDISVSVALEGDAATRVVATTDEDGGMKLAWSEYEQLGVYIKQADNSIIRAGYISSIGAEGDRGARTFRGKVKEKNDGENYIYMHPDIGEKNSIDYATQKGELGSTAHLTNLIPLIWTDNGNGGTLTAENKGYVVHVKMQFKNDPGIIKSVTLKSMDIGAEDNIFQGGFSPTQDYSGTNAITINVNGNAILNSQNGMWEADAYLVSAHREGNVYRSKYHVEVLTADNVKYNMCQYRSFPGQQEAGGNTLSMLANGKVYNLTAQFGEPGMCSTLVNTSYKVNSLLGMWNTFGQPYDPCALIHNGSNYALPPHVTDIIGNASKQQTMMERMLEGHSSQGTPTFTSYFDQSASTNNITIKDEPSEVYVTFLSEFAWSQNLLGYYHYTTAPAQPSSQVKNIIFANTSKGAHVPFNKDGADGGKWINPNEASNPGQNVGNIADAPLRDFTTVKLIYTDEKGFTSSKFPVGTTIGFFMMQDPKASSIEYNDDGTIKEGYTPRNDGTLLNWQTNRYFTDKQWNNGVTVFVSGAIAVDGNIKPGLAIYGARDNVNANYNYSYSAMLFMVSTEKAGSMLETNTKALNIGTGAQIINRQ